MQVLFLLYILHSTIKKFLDLTWTWPDFHFLLSQMFKAKDTAVWVAMPRSSPRILLCISDSILHISDLNWYSIKTWYFQKVTRMFPPLFHIFIPSSSICPWSSAWIKSVIWNFIIVNESEIEVKFCILLNILCLCVDVFFTTRLLWIPASEVLTKVDPRTTRSHTCCLQQL